MLKLYKKKGNKDNKSNLEDKCQDSNFFIHC